MLAIHSISQIKYGKRNELQCQYSINVSLVEQD